MADFPVSAKLDSKDIDKLIKLLRTAGKEAGIAEEKLDDLEDQTRRTGTNGAKNINQLNSSLSNLSTGFSKASKAFLAFMAIDRLKQLGKDILMTTAEFQKMEAVLTNTLGSNSKARLALNEIADFAARTPFSVTVLTENFIKLANRGVLPTMQQFTALGDLSATLGKDVSQVVEALLDVNNPERWKELGIVSQTAGNKVKLSFRGITVEADKTVESVTKAAVALGNMEGVAGSMEAISATLGGSISNLGDNLDQLANNFGKYNKGPVGEFFNLLNQALGKANQLMKSANMTASDHAEVRLKRFRDALADLQATIKDPSFKGDFEDLNLFYQDLTIAINDATEEVKEMQKEIDKGVNIKVEDLGGDIKNYRAVQGAAEEALETKKKLVEITKAEIAGYREMRKDVEKTVADWKKLAVPVKEHLGLIERLEKQIKKLEEAKKKAFTRDEIARLNDELVLLRTQLRIVSNTDYTTNLVRSLEELEKMFNITRKDLFDIEKANEKVQKRVLRQLKEFNKNYEQEQDDARKREKAALEKAEREKEAIIRGTFELTDILANEYSVRQQIRFDNELFSLNKLRSKELELAGDNAVAKDKINKKFDKEERELRRKKAQADRDQAVFNILLNTAQGVTAALTSIPPNIPLSIAIGITGAIEAALTRSRPLPKFAKGKYNLDGPGTATSDSIPAMLSRGESVVPTQASNKFGFLLKPMIENPHLELKDIAALMEKNIPYQLRGDLFQQKRKRSSNDQMLSELKGMRNDLSNLKQVSIEVDEEGFQQWTRNGDQWTKHVDKRYSA